MMTTAPAVRPANELYPIPDDAGPERLISEIATTGRDERMNFVLRRKLTSIDREVLSRRASTVIPHLAPARYPKIAKAVLSMLSGFGSKNTSDEEAQLIAAQYANVLNGLPLWVIERACLKFGRGEVDAADVGAKFLDRSYPPSSAQLRMIADKIARPYYSEAKRIEMTLRGTVAKVEITPEERERTGKKIAEYLATRKLEDEAVDLKEQQDGAARVADTTKRLILSEYSSAGIKPFYGANGILSSLSLLKLLGYTVEEIKGERVLVAPPKESEE